VKKAIYFFGCQFWIFQVIYPVDCSIILPSFDTKDVGQKIAADLGLREVYSELKPEGKIVKIQNFQKEGKTVVMVGDGIKRCACSFKS